MYPRRSYKAMQCLVEYIQGFVGFWWTNNPPTIPYKLIQQGFLCNHTSLHKALYVHHKFSQGHTMSCGVHTRPCGVILVQCPTISHKSTNWPNKALNSLHKALNWPYMPFSKVSKGHRMHCGVHLNPCGVLVNQQSSPLPNKRHHKALYVCTRLHTTLYVSHKVSQGRTMPCGVQK